MAEDSVRARRIAIQRQRRRDQEVRALLPKIASVVGVHTGEILQLGIAEGEALRGSTTPPHARVGWVAEVEAVRAFAASMAQAAGGGPAAMFLSSHEGLGGLVLPAERWCSAALELLEFDGDGVNILSLDGRGGFLLDVIDPTPYERTHMPEVQRFEWRVWGQDWLKGCGES